MQAHGLEGLGELREAVVGAGLEALNQITANILDLLAQITRQSLEPMVNIVTVVQASGTGTG